MKKKKFFLLFTLFISFFVFILSLYNIIDWYFNSKSELQELKQIANTTNLNNDKSSDTSFLQIEFSNLKEINESVVGWIKIEGTEIDYPFVQAIDNDFYLNHSFNKDYNRAGWIFLDYRNNINLKDKNTIIYGHAQNNKTMFGTLKNTLTEEWFNNTDNHFIKLSTEYENSIWQVFSIYTIPTTNDYLQIEFDGDFPSFINTLINRSIFNFNNTLNENDRILTLSTCHEKTSKTVLHAKLLKTKNR